MDFSFVSPHPVSAARLQVACATDRYKMFSHRAQRSLAAERRGQAGCMAGTCMGKGTAAQGHLAVCHTEGRAAPAQPACPGRSPATTHSAPLCTHTLGAHTQGSPPPAKPHKPSHKRCCPNTAPRNPAAVLLWRKLQHFYNQSATPSQRFLCWAFFFPPPFFPLF